MKVNVMLTFHLHLTIECIYQKAYIFSFCKETKKHRRNQTVQSVESLQIATQLHNLFHIRQKERREFYG